MCKWVKVFKYGPSKICGRQPSAQFTWSIFEYLDPNICQISNACKFLILEMPLVVCLYKV